MQPRERLMQRHTIKVSHETFVITDDTKARDIEAAALTAIRQGGGMINLVHDGSHNITVLISPGVPVFFTTETVDTEEPSSEGAETADWVDLDVAFQDPDT